jgi:hypothetical protein
MVVSLSAFGTPVDERLIARRGPAEMLKLNRSSKLALQPAKTPYDWTRDLSKAPVDSKYDARAVRDSELVPDNLCCHEVLNENADWSAKSSESAVRYEPDPDTVM